MHTDLGLQILCVLCIIVLPNTLGVLWMMYRAWHRELEEAYHVR